MNKTEAFFDEEYLVDESTDAFFAYVAFGAVHGPQSPPYTYQGGTKIAWNYKSNHMDMTFGSLVNMIEESGLAENTINIFTSDNDGIKTDGSTEHGHNIHGPCHGAKGGDVYEVGHRERVMSTR